MINPFSFCGRIISERFGDYTLVLSRPVAKEILEVLHRPELTARLSTLTGLDIRRALDIISDARIVELAGIPAVARDPYDDKLLATAKVASAEYVVSQDGDLLVLREYAGARIVDCATVLQLLEQGQACYY